MQEYEINEKYKSDMLTKAYEFYINNGYEPKIVALSNDVYYRIQQCNTGGSHHAVTTVFTNQFMPEHEALYMFGLQILIDDEIELFSMI